MNRWYTTNAHETAYNPTETIALGLERAPRTDDVILVWDLPELRHGTPSEVAEAIDEDPSEDGWVWAPAEVLVRGMDWRTMDSAPPEDELVVMRLSNMNWVLAKGWGDPVEADWGGQPGYEQFTCCRKHYEPLPSAPTMWAPVHEAIEGLVASVWSATGDLS